MIVKHQTAETLDVHAIYTQQCVMAWHGAAPLSRITNHNTVVRIEQGSLLLIGLPNIHTIYAHEGQAMVGDFIYPMMHRFILYYQAAERT